MGQSAAVRASTNRLARDLDNVLERTERLWAELRRERILITGATGFFGCWMLESFAWANRRLNLQARAAAVARRPQVLITKAPHLAAEGAITYHSADVCRDSLPRGKFSHVIHAATEASATLNREAPRKMFETIVDGARRTLDHASRSKTHKFLFVSSGAVYGTQPPEVTHISEDATRGPDPLDPTNAYAEGKRGAELLCAIASSAELEVKIARCFTFVGPYMQLDAHFAIGNLVADALRGNPLQVKGDGSAVRSYLYASDLAVWLWTTLFKGCSGRAYNVGSEDAVNIATLAHEVNMAVPQAVGIRIAMTPVPGTPVHRYVPSTARARQELGLAAEVPLGEAIRRTYRWFSEQRPLPQTTAVVASRGQHA